MTLAHNLKIKLLRFFSHFEGVVKPGKMPFLECCHKHIKLQTVTDTTVTDHEDRETQRGHTLEIYTSVGLEL